jgi:hypothetical protein
VVFLQLRKRFNRAHTLEESRRELDVRDHPSRERLIWCRAKEVDGAVGDWMVAENLRGAAQGTDAQRVVAALARVSLKLLDSSLQLAAHELGQC